MNAKWTRGWILPLAAGGMLLMAGCTVQTYGPGGSVTVTAPEPVVEVPDYYVWDGAEYVGWVGGAYFYLGPGNVWLACPPVVLDRWNVYIGAHPDFRAHAVFNDRFRSDAHGRFHPAPAHAGHAGPAHAPAHAAPAHAQPAHGQPGHPAPAKAPPKKDEHHE